ncbi:MAG TPA: NADH-ubiquinone oxidoreductase-F iron-sulfur binding region domain-containing protein [Bacteroidales bacterium]|nr:NADH-ubiquinone oxidoreductase-F iron-sulfur binding region domain-containing protein [Bacteroidales bacterium]HOM41173.1 NADH-ubiquinone oxidoreductase-F iron-sulfur binding region domain-containing protein [Bacteroidales bacterium]HQK71095.1 NADH-ubiquinone oxidoreductase-F iron-sulfur binding region domain-containing protein [Bacteroidales bacterium]
MENIKKFLIDRVLLFEHEILPDETEKVLKKIRREKYEHPVIYISSGTGSVISGAESTYIAAKSYFSSRNSEAQIINTGCSGPLNFEPFICIQLPGKNKLFFRNITEEKVEPLLDGVFHNDIPEEDIVGQKGSKDYGMWPGIPFIDEITFFAGQKRIVLGNCGCYDPESIEEYIARGGYRTFIKTIRNYTHSEVCDIIERSGLRGRSGGGYLTGAKWKSALNTSASSRYLICNAKESDPGAFVATTILESDPHRLIEGIAIAAYAIDATTAIIYLKAGTGIARKRITKALEQAREYGITGHNIFSSGFNLDIQIRTDPGAFVCGEETALIASLEGKRGMPRLKPPYPANYGLAGKPTVINNVETLMNVALIMENGPGWFRSIGTEKSKGTKIFSVSGKGRYTGVVEVEMGTTIRYIVEKIADGIRDGGQFKAVEIGGASGYFIDEASLDTAIDYEVMKEKGIGMGAGGFVIIDTSTCIVDFVKYYMEFIHNESCGKCIPCREGTARMFEILESVIRKPEREDSFTTLERFKGVMQLESIASVMKDASLCGLGQTAPNPFLSALEKFRDEFEEHIFDRKCRANVCRGLRTFVIDVEKCTGCTVCATRCPQNAIYGTRLQPFFIVEEKCSGCGICYEVCKFGAVIIK